MRDFNVCYGAHEKIGGCLPPKRACSDFRNAIDDCNLVALDTVGVIYTWCNRCREASSIDIRLHRAFCNLELYFLGQCGLSGSFAAFF